MSNFMPETFSEILNFLKSKPKQKVAIACAADEAVLKAAEIAYNEGILDSMLFGSEAKIKKVAHELKIDIEKFEIVDILDDKIAAASATEAVRNDKAHILMKGHLSTGAFLKAVLNKENGLRKSKVLSHVQVFECPVTNKIKMLSDGGMNLYPNEEILFHISENAINTFIELCGRAPVVAMISAYNSPAENLKSTQHMSKLAVDLTRETEYGFINAFGPVAVDVAVSKIIAEKEHITCDGPGKTDVFILPNIETGNLFGKFLMYFAKAPSAGLIMGAARPIIMLSRADEYSTKLNSMSVGCLLALRQRKLV